MRLWSSLALLALIQSVTLAAAGEDGVTAPAAGPSPPSDVDAHRAELDAITQNITVSQERQTELQTQIDGLDQDQATLNQNLIDDAAEVQRLEGQIDDSEQKLAATLTQEDQIKVSLAGRREVLSRVLAALQRLGDDPPPALLVRPEDALAAVRSAILLGAVVPDLKTAADALNQDLAKLTALETQQAKERDDLTANSEALLEGRAKITLLLQDKAAQRSADATALSGEQQHAADLAQQASDLQSLIAGLDSANTASIPPGNTASVAPGTPGTTRPVSLGNPGRLAPAVAFGDAKGLLPVPVNGKVISAFGDTNGLGGKAAGISLETRAGAEVVAPADGTIDYAGPFRSYGQLLIINAGSGYHVILAGMERIDVQLGQFVLAGEPVAAMASQQLASAGATLVGTTDPVLYVEFRNGSTSIDPSPWWAASN